MSRTTYQGRVIPAWIDRNGHMNMAYYIVVFDLATDALFELAGIGAEYTARSGNTIFTVEIHTLYEQELTLGAPLRIASTVLGGDAKRLHLAHEMFNEAGGRVAAFESMNLHVGMASRRVLPFPPDRQAAIAALAAEAAGARPAFAGRRIALPG